MNVILLNHILDRNTPSYGNRDQIDIKPASQISEGDTANSLSWHFSINHIGTHIDLPRHFYEEGDTITDVEPAEWIFKTVSLVDIPCNTAHLITKDDLKASSIDPETDLLLIRTGFEKYRKEPKYWQAYPGISSKASSWLRDKFSKLRGIGFDFISLTSPTFKEEGKRAHQIFLDQKKGDFVLIIEDMKLSELNFVPDRVIVSPMIIHEADGSPVTIFAMNN